MCSVCDRTAKKHEYTAAISALFYILKELGLRKNRIAYIEFNDFTTKKLRERKNFYEE